MGEEAGTTRSGDKKGIGGLLLIPRLSLKDFLGGHRFSPVPGERNWGSCTLVPTSCRNSALERKNYEWALCLGVWRWVGVEEGAA